MKNSPRQLLYVVVFLFSFLGLAPVVYAQPIAENIYCPQGSILDTNIIVNGDFSAGNTGFTSAYTFASGGSSSLWPAGVYAISHNPNNEHPMAAAYYDHTTGAATGYMMAINGASSVVDIWCETVAVTPGSNYEFSAWFRNWSSDTASNLPTIQYKINGTLIGTSSFTFLGTLAAWSQFSYTWYSGTNTTATICINDQQTASIGNDFSIDDISFRRCLPPANAPGVKMPESVLVFPNPSAGNFSVSNTSGVSSIDIYDIVGKKVFSATSLLPGVKNDVDLRDHPDGVYFVELRSGQTQERRVEKIIIQR